MVDEQSWVAKRTAGVKSRYPTVTDAVTKCIEELLADSFSQSEQSKTQLKAVARELLQANIPAVKQPETKP